MLMRYSPEPMPTMQASQQILDLLETWLGQENKLGVQNLEDAMSSLQKAFNAASSSGMKTANENTPADTFSNKQNIKYEKGLK